MEWFLVEFLPVDREHMADFPPLRDTSYCMPYWDWMTVDCTLRTPDRVHSAGEGPVGKGYIQPADRQDSPAAAAGDSQEEVVHRTDSAVAEDTRVEERMHCGCCYWLAARWTH